MILQINPERCRRCDYCDLEVGCFGQAVDRPDRDGPPVIDTDRCYGCGLCTMICRHGAVEEKLRSTAR